MARDAGEDGIASEQDCVAIDGALRDVGVRGRGAHSPRPKVTAQLTDAHPVAAWSLVERELLEQVLDGGAFLRPARSAHQLRDDDGREHDKPLREGILERRDRDSREEVDPDGRVSDDPAHGTP